MAKKKKPRPLSQWRYGNLEEPLFIKEESGRETFVEFVGGRITHEEFCVSVRGHWHTFKFNKLYAYKTQIFEESWVSEVTYWSLLGMAEHVMKAVFGGFQPKAKTSKTPLTVMGHGVQLLRLKRELLVFSWHKREYTVSRTCKNGLVFEEPTDSPLPAEVRRFFEIFAINIWPKLPLYRTPEEIENDKAERAIAKAPPVTLLDPTQAPAQYRKKRPRQKLFPKNMLLFSYHF